MTAAVDQALTGRLVMSPDVFRGIHANLRYLRDDPFAVHLAFPAAVGLDGEEVEWVFSRELLDDGLYEPAGDGDLHLWPVDRERVMIEFESSFGTALVEFPAADLRSFLHYSYQAVPAGREPDHLDLDADLAELLGQ